MLLRDPREVSWVNYCHSFPVCFVAPGPSRIQSDSHELNEYLHLKVISGKGSINHPSCFPDCPVSVATSVLGSFLYRPSSLQEHLKIQCWKYSNKTLTKAHFEFLRNARLLALTVGCYGIIVNLHIY